MNIDISRLQNLHLDFDSVFSWWTALWIYLSFGVISHFWNLPKVRRWNAMSYDERQKLLKLLPSTDDRSRYNGSRTIDHRICIASFFFGMTLGPLIRIIYTMARIFYNLGIRYILGLLMFKMPPKMKAWSAFFGYRRGIPAARFF